MRDFRRMLFCHKCKANTLHVIDRAKNPLGYVTLNCCCSICSNQRTITVTVNELETLGLRSEQDPPQNKFFI